MGIARTIAIIVVTVATVAITVCSISPKEGKIDENRYPLHLNDCWLAYLREEPTNGECILFNALH